MEAAASTGQTSLPYVEDKRIIPLQKPLGSAFSSRSSKYALVDSKLPARLPRWYNCSTNSRWKDRL